MESSFIMEYIDRKGYKRKVTFESSDERFYVKGNSECEKADTLVDLVNVLSYTGITKVVKSNSRWIGDVEFVSRQFIQRGVYSYLGVYVKLYNTNYSKTFLSDLEFHSLCKIMKSIALDKLYSYPFTDSKGAWKVKDLKNKKVMSLSTFLKYISGIIPSIVKLVSKGYTPDIIMSLALIMDRVGASYLVL